MNVPIDHAQRVAKRLAEQALADRQPTRVLCDPQLPKGYEEHPDSVIGKQFEHTRKFMEVK